MCIRDGIRPLINSLIVSKRSRNKFVCKAACIKCQCTCYVKCTCIYMYVCRVHCIRVNTGIRASVQGELLRALIMEHSINCRKSLHGELSFCIVNR